MEKNIADIAIKIENVSKTFDKNFKALDNINLQIYNGEFFALLGANGAGKTTLISALSGLIKLDSGNIFINNYSIKNNIQKAKYNIGIVPQELVFDPFFTSTAGFKDLPVYSWLPTLEKYISKILALSLTLITILASAPLPSNALAVITETPLLLADIPP